MKRIVCFLLALIMVLGLIPNTVVTANAASKLNTSENARKILEGSLKSSFLSESNGTYVGYLTPVSFADAAEYLDGITKEEALDLMNAYITKVIDKEINEFTQSMNLTLSRGQHDALALHSYRMGLSSDLKEAARTGKKGNDLIAVFVDEWGVAYPSSGEATLGTIEKASMDVALAEAAMYLNGSYGYNGGDKLSYVLLDFDGDFAADEAHGYVVADGFTLPEVPAGALGWYLYDAEEEATTGSPLTKATKTHKEKLIVAKQASGGNDDAEYSINTSKLSDLNVYSWNSVDPEKTGKVLKSNSTFKVTKEYLDGDEKWVYGSGTDTKGKKVSGWVYVGKAEAGEDADAKPIASATVTAATLPVWPGATEGKAGDELDILNKDENVKIYETKIEATNTGNKKWGKVMLDTDNDGEIDVIGWINLALTSVNETDGESGSIVGKTGKIANTDKVNIRKADDVTSDLLTTLKEGTKVTVLKLNDTQDWGLIKWEKASDGYTQGWVYMHYVQMDDAFAGTEGGNTNTNNGTVKYTGIVTSNINLNVRKAADIYAAKVDSLPNGTKINIYEVTTSRNMKWGRIGENRWVCLTYVALTEVAQPEGGAGSSTSTSVQATVKPATLDIYKNYNANSQKVGSLVKGDVVTLLERKTENTSSGTRIWGRIKVGEVEGWINLAYTDVKTVTTVTGGTESNTGSSSNAGGASGTVSNCISVNVRSAAGVYNALITKLNNGTSVKVYERVTKDGAPWARITWNNDANEGWVCMNYVTMNTQNGGTAADGTVGGTNSNTISVTGYVNSNVDLKVRAGAGLGYAQIGALKKGTKVSVYEQMSADGLIWGRTTYGEGSGWICMSYITVENTSSTGKGIMGTVARCFAAVNVRSAPGTNNALVAKINVGTRVEVFETKQHGTQMWGRVAQGWVCMDYILLDSELPPGTVLDATVPTTEATQPGETTEPDDGLNLDGAVKCSISGVVGSADLVVYNDADDESQEVGSIRATKSITVVGVKKNGTEVWGLINQNGTQGWIKLDNASCTFKGYVNTNEQPIYASASTGNVVGEMNIDGVEYTINKLGTDGTTAFAWIESESAWIPISKLSATEPEAQIPFHKADVGSGSITATTTAVVTAYKSTSTSSDAVFKIDKGYDAYVSEIDFVGTQVWGLVEDGTNEGWINLANTYFDLDVAAKDEMIIYTARDESKPMTDETDETVKITRPAGTVFTVRVLTFDSNGNIWAEIVKTDAAINNCFIIIANGNGNVMNVDYV